MQRFKALVDLYFQALLDKDGIDEMARDMKQDPEKKKYFLEQYQKRQAQQPAASSPPAGDTAGARASDTAVATPRASGATPAPRRRAASGRTVLLIADELKIGDDMAVYRHFENSWMASSSFLLTVDVDEMQSLVRDQRLKDCFMPPSPDQLKDFPHLRRRFWLNLHKRPSLALCDLAVAVRDAGYDPIVIDGFMWRSWRLEQIRQVVETYDPILIGLSTTFIVNPRHVFTWVQTLREIAPDVPLVLGGPTVRSHAELHALGDFAVFGDGEDPLLGILEAIQGRRPIDSVPYTAFRQPDGTAGYGPASVEAAQLGRDGRAYQTREAPIPIADWTLYARSRSEVYPLELSRGCRYNCFYCNYDRGKYVRALERIRDELLRNAELGITRYRIVDSTFTDGPPGANRFPYDVCKLMLELDLGLEWSCFARADEMNDELAGLMKAAGCYATFFGIESGDDHILKLMRKGHNVADAEKGILLTKRHGISTHANFVVGYPGETLETFNNTLEFVERTRPDTFTLGELFVSRDAPINGPRMAEFKLEGNEMTWRHSTMDSVMAEELCVKGADRLLAGGLTMSSEVLQSMFLAFGVLPAELHQSQRDSTLLMSPDTSPELRREAEGRVNSIRKRIIAEVIEDERMMESTL